MSIFKVGDKVDRSKGSYRFPGTVLSVYETVEGKVRYDVQLAGLGMIHIFREQDLMFISLDSFNIIEKTIKEVLKYEQHI